MTTLNPGLEGAIVGATAISRVAGSAEHAETGAVRACWKSPA